MIDDSKTKEDLELLAENIGRYARKIFDEVVEVAASAETVADAIREKPIQSSLIAAGIGLVLGLIFSKR